MNRCTRIIAMFCLLGMTGLFIARGFCEEVSDDALINCKEPYCPGLFGFVGQDTSAKLAIIKIWRQTNAVNQLVELFPKCNGQGQTYVLAALWHLDKAQFEKLSKDFLKDKGEIVRGSADILGRHSREEMVRLLQGPWGFHNPPKTLEEISKEWRQQIEAQIDAIANLPELRKALRNYSIIFPFGDLDEQVVEITPEPKKFVACQINWLWQKQNEQWIAKPSIDEISEVIKDIDKAKFIQELNKQIKLEIKLDAAAGNFYPKPPDFDSAAQEDEDVIKAKALFKSIGYKGTNQLVQITAENEGAPLILWHPVHTQLWLITWNLKISPDWHKAYEKQTRLKLDKYETAEGWVATCNSAGKLKMIQITPDNTPW